MLQIKAIVAILTVSCILSGDVVDSIMVEWIFVNKSENLYSKHDEHRSIVPEELKNAYTMYCSGNYQKASEILYNVKRLQLPDGTLETIACMLAECYRKLGLREKAIKEYQFIASQLPDTDKKPAVLYRMLEYAVEENKVTTADSIMKLFDEKYADHQCHSSVLYEYAKLCFNVEDFNKSLLALGRIKRTSKRHIQAVFLSSLCHIRLHEWDVADSLLTYVHKHARQPDLKVEALLVKGDIHYQHNRIDKAIECYKCIHKKSKRYEYARVKIARCLLDLGLFEQVAEEVEPFLPERPTSRYFFEMAVILGQAHENRDKKTEVAALEKTINRHVASYGIVYAIADEIEKGNEITNQWREWAIQPGQTDSAITCARQKIQKGEYIVQKARNLGYEIQNIDTLTEKNFSSYLSERRYLSIVRKSISNIEDSLGYIKIKIDAIDTVSHEKSTNDSSGNQMTVLKQKLSELKQQHNNAQHEYNLILSECFNDKSGKNKSGEEMLAKFIDWNFIHYLESKTNQVALQEKLNSKKKNGAKGKAERTGINDKIDYDSLLQDSLKIAQGLPNQREQLINSIEMMIDLFPGSRFVPDVLFRLAELYFDRSGDRFQEAMQRYEQKLLENGDSINCMFPEYNLDDVIKIYKRIYDGFAGNNLADDAMYYSALSLKKQGMEDSATTVLLTMVDRYPQSEYYVEASMNIGRYYFENAKNYANGYELARKIFATVLHYRNHPHFIEALYYLGWCYYMEDRYEEAIETFGYMIGEVDLEFDPFAKDEKDVANPLLRSEAVDYLAISLDQDRNLGDAVKFLNLIGNDDYAGLVAHRMAQLREEDLDFNGAIAAYRMLVNNYPLSMSAPEAVIGLIKLYKNGGDTVAADSGCRKFIKEYGAGGDWQDRMKGRDTMLIAKTDSTAIAIGLSLADNAYRAAENRGGNELYAKASLYYREIAEKYPSHPQAAIAAWNLATILNDKINKKTEAFELFIAFSDRLEVKRSQREDAAVNAIAIAQSLLPIDSATTSNEDDVSIKRFEMAVENYMEKFGGGTHTSRILFATGGVFFNRKMYTKAALVYKRILMNETCADRYHEAMLLSGQCSFGKEEWRDAALVFETLITSETPEPIRSKAIILLQQSLFYEARGLMAAEKYNDAAELFIAIEERFHEGDYGDVALFNAAEAFEKKGELIRASDSYFRLVNRYPQSPLSPDALFNAAGNFEKMENYDRAAETYEMLIARYSETGKAKDALFNIGFCYEKLGNLDDMTAANERYGLLYPEEKDAGALLMRSASYYMNAAMFGKAVNLYENFIRRFPINPLTVEAYYNIGMCQIDSGDQHSALESFVEAEKHNRRIENDGGKPNNYFAAEAAYSHGIILEKRFGELQLRQPESFSDSMVKKKTELLSEAVNDYERVMQYGSEKIFEAGFRIGQLYEKMAEAIAYRERPRVDPLKKAVKENELMNMASTILRNAFVPYRKVLQLSKDADSVTENQKTWVEKSENRLGACLLLAGKYSYDGVGAMQNAPVPKEIASDPLLCYQYKIKLLETLEPLKKKVLDYYNSMLDSLPHMNLDDSITIMCEIHICRLNYLIGSAYHRLATDILNSTSTLPKNIQDSEREDLIFQLEDLIYELQDKALFELEESRRQLISRKLDKNDWFSKIVASLARLDPEKYGRSFYGYDRYTTDETWVCRQDSIDKWNSSAPPVNGWIAATIVERSFKPIRPDDALFVRGDTSWNRGYFWKNVFINGKPLNSSITVLVPGNYRLFINGVLAMSDTSGKADKNGYDSLKGIETLLRGGDNSIACEAACTAAPVMIALSLHVMTDTSEKYISSVSIPKLPEQRKKREGALTNEKVRVLGGNTGDRSPEKLANEIQKDVPRKSRRAVLTETLHYRQREKAALDTLRRERMLLEKLRTIKSGKGQKKIGDGGTTGITDSINTVSYSTRSSIQTAVFRVLAA